MIDSERVKRWAVEGLKARGFKAELSPQAVAVVEAICRELNGDKPAKLPVSLKKQLTDGWCAAYAAAKGRKYLFEGAKDGKAADRLLALGLTVETLLETARQAWANPGWFNCKQAATLAGFACRYNDICDELENPPDVKPAYRRAERDDNPHNFSGISL